MTKEEAINTLDRLQKAILVLDANKAREAFNALINDTRVVTTAMQRVFEAVNAVQTLRRAFEEIDGKGIQFPSN
jgi:hypothetical protein